MVLDKFVTAAEVGALAVWEWLETGLVFHPTRLRVREHLYDHYRELRERDPFHRSRPAGGWILTRYHDVLGVLRDPRFSSDERNGKRYARIRIREARAASRIPTSEPTSPRRCP